jgi:hypothetical protein
VGEDIDSQLSAVVDRVLEVDGFSEADRDHEKPLSEHNSIQRASLSYRNEPYEISVMNHPGGEFALLGTSEYSCPRSIRQIPVDAPDQHIKDAAEDLYSDNGHEDT